MPNGADKNWVRLCAALDGFRMKYGSWPKRVRLDAMCLEDLRAVFSPPRWAILTEHIDFVPEAGVGVQAEDGTGSQTYCYGTEGFPDRQPEPDARGWLGIHPDRLHDD